MFPFRGNTSSIAETTQLNLPTVIKNFAIVNKTGGAVAVNVYLVDGVSSVNISPFSKSIGAGEMYESERQVIVLASEIVRLQVSGSVDYDFNIVNSEAPITSEL